MPPATRRSRSTISTSPLPAYAQQLKLCTHYRSRFCSPLEPRTLSAVATICAIPFAVCRRSKEAGADVLYAPGLRTLAEVREVGHPVTRPVDLVPGPPDPAN